MKNFIKTITKSIAKNPYLWKLFDRTILIFTRTLEQNRREYVNSKPKPILSKEVAIIAPDLIVKYGPFRGMRYPNGETKAYNISSKLLGLYEAELHPIIERIIKNDYSEIVDIGCAEGYYAIGLGMTTNAEIYAYDIDTHVLKSCYEMAKLNNVNISTNTYFGPETFKKLDLKKALIFSDCEGYEKEIFNKDTLPFLLKSDLLIEVHDFKDITVSTHLKNLFRDSHNLEIIESMSDTQRALNSNYKELEIFDMQMRKILLSEYRPSQMQWFYFTHK